MSATGREWVVEFPPGTTLLTANARLHWAARSARTRALRDAAQVLARAARIPQLEHADIVVEYEPPPPRKHMRHPRASQRITDSDALWPTQKAALDGIADAGVFASDHHDHVRRVTCMVKAKTHRQGLLRVRIIELEAERE